MEKENAAIKYREMSDVEYISNRKAYFISTLKIAKPTVLAMSLEEVISIEGDELFQYYIRRGDIVNAKKEALTISEAVARTLGRKYRADACQAWHGLDDTSKPAETIISGTVYSRKPSGKTLANWQVKATYTTGRGKSVRAWYVVSNAAGVALYCYIPATQELRRAEFQGRTE